MPSAVEVHSAAKEKGIAYGEQAKKKARSSREDIESYLREKFPKQRQDAVINRLKKVITDIQQNPDFTETIEFLVELAQKYIKSIKTSVQKEAGKSKVDVGIQKDEHFDRAIQEAKVWNHSLSRVIRCDAY
jgi:Family of unknown function (DUF5923)